MTETVQDLVIGAGVVGVNCAFALADAGRDVVLLDQGTVASGCSHGNAGWITPCHSLPIPGPGLVGQSLKWMLRSDSPLFIRPTLRPSMLAWLFRFYQHCDAASQLRGLKVMAELNRHVVPLTRDLIERLNLDCEFQQRGVMYVYRSPEGFDKGAHECEHLVAHGIRGEVLDAAAVREREPMITDRICGGVSYPDEADAIPDRFVKELAQRLPELGVRLLMNTRVEHIVTAGRTVTDVATTNGTFRPENVVLAAGAWTAVLARRLGLKLALEPGKGYSVTLPRQAGIPNRPLNLSEAKVAVTPWNDTVRLGGTMELAGLQLRINRKRVAAVVRAAREYLPQFRAENALEVWTGMRPVTSDGLPIIGRSNKLDNLILATGHGMLGLTQSVVTARLVADLITGNPSLVPLAPFSPDRF